MKDNKHLRKLQKPKGDKPTGGDRSRKPGQEDRVKYRHMAHWLEEDDEIVLYKKKEEE